MQPRAHGRALPTDRPREGAGRVHENLLPADRGEPRAAVSGMLAMGAVSAAGFFLAMISSSYRATALGVSVTVPPT